MQIKVGGVAAPQTWRHIGCQIKTVAHSALAMWSSTHLALPAFAARQRGLHGDAITLSDPPAPRRRSADLFDPADSLMAWYDRDLAESTNLEFATILVVI